MTSSRWPRKLEQMKMTTSPGKLAIIAMMEVIKYISQVALDEISALGPLLSCMHLKWQAFDLIKMPIMPSSSQNWMDKKSRMKELSAIIRKAHHQISKRTRSCIRTLLETLLLSSHLCLIHGPSQPHTEQKSQGF